MSMSDKYVVVTAISSHRVRYVIPADKLQEISPNDVPLLDDKTLKEWACDSVVMEEVEEFSQDWMGEYISDVTVEPEEVILNRFDEENKYLASWSKEQKLEWIERQAKKVKSK